MIAVAVSSGCLLVGSHFAHHAEWSGREEYRLKTLWFVTKSVSDIAFALGRSRNAIYEHASRMQLPPRRSLGHNHPMKQERRVYHDPRMGRALRDCLTCGRSFRSRWMCNRICDDCKATYF